MTLSRERCPHRTPPPISSDLEYPHGASLEAARIIAQDGLSRCQRLHIHFYECDQNGHVLDGDTIRCGSDDMAVVFAHQCIEGGMAFYRSSNNVILSEGFGGVIGPQYFRFVLRLRRNPHRRRDIIWEPSKPPVRAMESVSGAQPAIMLTQTKPEAVEKSIRMRRHELSPKQS